MDLLSGRFLLLLAALVIIKVPLLGLLNDHLFHSHWRVREEGPFVLDKLGYSLLVVLVPTSLGLLMVRGRDFPPRTIRRLNLAFVFVGLVFVLLCRERVRVNYIWPVIQGWIGPREVGWYLALDFFFGPPWLAVYCVLYPLVYWWLVRTRREHWSFLIMGFIAAFYLVLELHGLHTEGRYIALVDCFGIAGLLSAWRNRRPLGDGWQAAVAGCFLLGWLIFLPRIEGMRGAENYFAAYTALVVSGYLVCWAMLRRSSTAVAVSHWLPFYLLAFLLLANRAYPYAVNFDHVTVYALALPHYFFPEALLTGGALLLGMVCHRFIGDRARFVFDALAAFLVLLAVADLKLTQTMDIRMDWNVLVVANSPLMLWRTVRPYAVQLLMAVGVLLGLYAVSLRLFDRAFRRGFDCIRQDRSGNARFLGLAYLLVALAAPWMVTRDKAHGSSLVNVVATSPMVKVWEVPRYDVREFLRRASELGLPDFTLKGEASGPARPADLNVLLIQMESSYNRHLSLFGSLDETQPLLSRYRDRMELFPNVFANFPNSFHARFSVLSGLYATTEYVSYINPRLGAPSLPEILRSHGYANEIFDSCFREYARWGDYISHRGLDLFYDSNNMPNRQRYRPVSWGVAETATLDAIKDQLRLHAQRRDRFFLTYLPVAPHMPFDLPDRRFARFDIARGVLHRDYTGAYKNLLLYMDWIISSIVDEMKALDLLDHTLVIVTNDHGEMLGEDSGKLGHGWNLEPYLCNTPLIIMDPRRQSEGARTNLTYGSQVDLLPTLLDLLNVPLPADELYEGVSLYSNAAINRPIYVTSYRQRVLIENRRLVQEDPLLPSEIGAQHWQSAYSIHNDGTATVFEPVQAFGDIAPRMDRFQEFQLSLITHYAYYRDAVRQLKKDAAGRFSHHAKGSP